MVVPPAGDLSPRPASADRADHFLGALSPRADLVPVVGRAVAVLREGERVLDLGSGGGIDVLLSARRVGPPARLTAST